MIKTCPICQCEFEVKKHEAWRRVCCSVKCSSKLHSQKMTGEGNSHYGEKVVTVICNECGKNFERKKRLIRKCNILKAIFCSYSCAAKYHIKQKPDWGKIFLGKKRPDMSGDKNPNWKGGITQISRGIRHSAEYQRWRKAVIRRDGKCVICDSFDNLHADHILPFVHYPDLVFDTENGRTLCQPCHVKTETYGNRVHL